jgi:hypothetical protein
MRSKIKLKHKIITAINAAAVAGAIILTVIGSSAAKAQRYNYAWQRWKCDSKENYGQVSCYLGKEAGFDLNSVNSVRNQLLSKLSDASVTPQEGKKLISYAYSTPVGNATMTCDATRRVDADFTAVGGDFFFFRNFTLRSGSFFSDDDLMHNGAVIDRKAAFTLYGSDDIIGKNLYVNNVKLFVMGVIDLPATKAEKSCVNDIPKAYITYDAADLIFGEGSYDSTGLNNGSGLKRVTCFECISPDPVENFTYNIITGKNSIAEQYKGKISVVDNKKRFEPKTRIKALKKIDDFVVVKEDVIYPYWENASRMTDVKLSFIYGARRLLLIIPVITMAVLFIKALMLYNRKKAGLKKALADWLSVKWSELKGKFGKKAVQAAEKES